VKVRLGDIIHGYKVITQHEDSVILAVNTNPDAVDKAVVWYLDYQGEPHTGDYYLNVEAAQEEFVSRAFERVCY